MGILFRKSKLVYISLASGLHGVFRLFYSHGQLGLSVANGRMNQIKPCQVEILLGLPIVLISTGKFLRSNYPYAILTTFF